MKYQWTTDDIQQGRVALTDQGHPMLMSYLGDKGNVMKNHGLPTDDGFWGLYDMEMKRSTVVEGREAVVDLLNMWESWPVTMEFTLRDPFGDEIKR